MTLVVPLTHWYHACPHHAGAIHTCEWTFAPQLAPPDVLSAAGAHAEPFHFKTCPLVAADCAIFEGRIPVAIFASVTAEAAISAVHTVPSAISLDPTDDLYARLPSAASWASTETKLAAILFHSVEERPDPVEAVCTVCNDEYAASATDTKATEAAAPSQNNAQETSGFRVLLSDFMPANYF